MQEFVPKDEGLVVESKKDALKSKDVKKNQGAVKSKEVKSKDVKGFCALPKPKSKRQVASGRVGVGAKRRRETANINVNPISKPSKIEEELITMEDFNTMDLKQDLGNYDDIIEFNQLKLILVMVI